MTDEAPLLTVDLLGELEHRWRTQGAPVAENLNTGLEADEIDGLTQPLGLRLPVETKTWWGWHNGAGKKRSRLIGPGREYLPLEEAIDLYEQELEIFSSIEGAEPLRPPSRFPILYLSGPVHCDCSVPEGAPTPIYTVHSHDYDIDGVRNPRTRSFGEMVQWWIEALDDGIWRWDKTARRWDFNPQNLARERSLSGLV